jgi:plasmid maintenance system antidote protein VapI
MVKDKRHKTVKILIEGSHVTEFSQIFEHIPKTAVANQLGIHFNRIQRMIESPGEIKINDLFMLSRYFEIDAKVLFDLIYNQKSKNKKKQS